MRAVDAPAPNVAYSPEAEQSVLGAILLDMPAALPRVVATGLRPDDFYDDRHALIHGAALAIHDRGESADIITVFAELRAAGKADRVGGLPYLNSLAASVLTAANAGRYAGIVMAMARRRRAQTAARALANLSASSGLTDEQFAAGLADARRELDRIADATVARAPSLPIEWARDLGEDAQLPEQLVEGVLTKGGLSSIYGQPNAGKSYIAGHMAICVATGRAWLGRRTTAAPVLYVAAEGAASLRARFQAYRRHFGQDLGELALVARPLNLMDPSPDVDALIATAAAMAAQAGTAVGLVVIDTLARVMAGGDENSGQDMGALIGAAERVKASTGAHVALVHHMGKDATRGARGHSSLRAALDTEIEVTVDEPTKTHYAKVTKQRDLASKGETFACKFVPVELGVDQWGSPITACAVEPSEVGIGAPAPRKLTAAQQAVMGYLAGHDTGAKRAAIVAALEPQGVSRPSVYRAVNELLNGGMVTDISGVVYAPKVA